MTLQIATPLRLPCGAVLSNRLAKAAMSEGLADSANHSTPQLETLYRTWARSGAALLLSGNVQVDRHHLERAGNIVIDDASGIEALKRLAKAGTEGGAHFWVQLSHTGRQVEKAINPAPLAPSVVEIDPPRGLPASFATPVEMAEADIANAISQFAFAAGQVRDAGFTGVQFHAAHGYLLSQFLSPLSNRRQDRWGGTLANRARLLMDTLSAVRAAVGADFPIGIKLNASDFQKGGFTHAECVELVLLLNQSSLDLLELSGGSLEQPKLLGLSIKNEGQDARSPGTVQREAYFAEFAGEVTNAASMPVMVTGGFRTLAAMNRALAAGELDVIGLARPMAIDPMTPRGLLSGAMTRATTPEDRLAVFDLMPWNSIQLKRMGDGLSPDPAMDGKESTVAFMLAEEAAVRRHLSSRSAPKLPSPTTWAST